VVARRQLLTRGCDDKGGFRVAGVARGSRCGVRWQAIRGTDGAEVATSPGSSTGQAASGPRSGARIMRSVGFLQAAPSSGGVVRSGSAAPCRVERRGTTLHGVAPSPVLHASSQVVSTQRSRRVAIGGNVDDSDRWVERAARIASRIRGRFGSERALRSSSRRFLPSTLALVSVWRLLRKRESRVEAGRGTRWLPMRGEGRSRPEPNPPARSSWREAQASRRGGGAGGERRELRGDATPSSSRIRAAAKGRAIETFPASATASERNRSKGQWRRAFALTRRTERRFPSGSRPEARRGGAPARTCCTEGRDPPGNRLERHRRSAPAGNRQTDGRAPSGERSEVRWGTATAWNRCSESQLPFRRESVRSSSGEGHPPGAVARRIEACRVPAVHARGNPTSVATSSCPMAALAPRVRGPSTIGRTLVEGGDRRPSPPACWRRRADDRCGTRIPGQPGVRRTGRVVQLSALPRPSAKLRRGGGGNTTGSDVMWVIGRVQSAVRARGGWCRRLRRGRRAKLVIGESGLRLARSVARSSSVSSPSGLYAVPQRAWQHVRCAGSPRRCWTFSAVIRARLRAPGRPFGVSRVHRREPTVLRCETNRHALRSDGTRSLLSGRVGGDRAVAATSRQGSGRTPHRPGIPGCGSEAMASRFR
jgi:hypothetical protein